MLAPSSHREKIAEAMRASGIADDRNNPHAHKEFVENAVKVLRRRYVMKDLKGQPIEQPNEIFPRVAQNLSQAEQTYNKNSPAKSTKRVLEAEEEFFNVMVQHLFLPNSPTLMNAGARLQQLSACFVLPVEDSLSAIFQSVKETALIHQSGGGTGFSFARLRPNNDIVGSTGGVASGPVGFIRVFDTATDVVKQGGTRRGANMAVLRVDHPDILEFIHAKDSGDTLENFNISVAVTDTFMKAVIEDGSYDLINPRDQSVVGQYRALEIWRQIVDSAHLTGDPGLIFIDTINATNPNPHLGPIEAVNPCVTGDTIVYTASGLRPIEELLAESQFHDIATDGRFQAGHFNLSTAVMQSGVKPIYRLTTQEGYQLRLTADHKVMTTRGWVPASDLHEGDLIHIANSGGGFGTQGDEETGTVLGWLIADGTVHGSQEPGACLDFYGEKRQLVEPFTLMVNDIIHRPANARHIHVGATAVIDRDLETVKSTRLAALASNHGLTPGNKHHVPTSVLQGTQQMQAAFLRALFTADGTVLANTEKGACIRLSSSYEQLLHGVQNLLLNFGIAARLYMDRYPAKMKAMPNGKGGHSPYQTRANHELHIGRENAARFRDQVGFMLQSKQDKLENALNSYERGPYKESFTARFKSLDYEGEEPVYDLTEPNSHSFIANGIVVSNCGEQPLLPNEACNLGSINLARMVSYPENGPQEINWDLLEKVCHTAVHMLDNVIDMNRFPTEPVRKVTQSTRRIGVGVMGTADMLVQLGLPYDSEEARELAGQLMKFINDKVHDASRKLASSRGAYPEQRVPDTSDHNHAIRNTAPTTIAPTGTISIIANASSGIEPLFALAYTRNVMDQTKLAEVNPYFLAAAKAHGFYSEEVMEHVARTGSIQDTNLPQWAKDVFKTAQDISPQDHVLMQAAFQEHVENGVSKTINFPNHATKADIQDAYLLAYNTKCKGITVYRDGSKAGQVLSTGNTSMTQPETTVNGRVQARQRPRTMTGTTERVRTAHGNVYVTINRDDSLDPFELFCQVGKAGSCDSAQIEAISRMISLALRANIDPTEIITNLRGITCCVTWDQGTRVNSIPDAIAQVLHHVVEPLANATNEETYTIPLIPDQRQEYPRPQVLCPDCQSPTIFQEGCQSCTAPGCGWNKCE